MQRTFPGFFRVPQSEMLGKLVKGFMSYEFWKYRRKWWIKSNKLRKLGKLKKDEKEAENEVKGACSNN